MLEYQDRVEKTGYKGPVSQINLLCFHQTEGAKESYGKYGAGFVKVGGRHGLVSLPSSAGFPCI
jgi:hypothetical protein